MRARSGGREAVAEEGGIAGGQPPEAHARAPQRTFAPPPRAGSHTVLELLQQGYKVTISDNLDNSFAKAFERMKELAGDKSGNMTFVQVGLRRRGGGWQQQQQQQGNQGQGTRRGGGRCGREDRAAARDAPRSPPARCRMLSVATCADCIHPPTLPSPPPARHACRATFATWTRCRRCSRRASECAAETGGGGCGVSGAHPAPCPRSFTSPSPSPPPPPGQVRRCNPLWGAQVRERERGEPHPLL